MPHLRQLAIVILTTIMLNACGSVIGEPGKYGFFTPMPMMMRNVPQGDDSYSVGFRDGCYTFLGVQGHGIHRIYDAGYNPDFLYDSLYRQGFQHGDRYCGCYVNKANLL